MLILYVMKTFSFYWVRVTYSMTILEYNQHGGKYKFDIQFRHVYDILLTVITRNDWISPQESSAVKSCSCYVAIPSKQHNWLVPLENHIVPYTYECDLENSIFIICDREICRYTNITCSVNQVKLDRNLIWELVIQWLWANSTP